MPPLRKTATQCALPFEPPAKPEEPQPSASSGFVGYDEQGRLVHYCHCGKWGAFGHGASLKDGKLGQWFCREHRP